jgi:hypothetical protein
MDEEMFLRSYYIHPFDQESLGMWGFFFWFGEGGGRGLALSIWTAVNE